MGDSVREADVDGSGADALPNEKPAKGLGTVVAGVVEAVEEPED